MKVVIIFYSIFEIINGIYSIYSQPLDDNSIIQYSDDYYKKHSQENLDDLNLKIKDRLRKHNTIKTNSNRIKPNTNNRKNNFESNSKIEEQIDKIDIEFVDMIVKEREVKLFISGENACNVKVEDKILYEQHEKNSHFLEHLILNSNYDYITPENLKSDDIQIDFLSFNRKLNLFSVFYENPKNLTQYSIEYDYMAVNLIKTYKSYNLTNEENVLNYIIWKFYNENSVNIKQKLRIIFHFELGKNFEKENVAFFQNNNNSTMNFEKKILKNLNTPRQTVLYEWNGFINPNEVIVLNAKFPLYFDNCQLVKISVPIIVAGSIFIIFLIFVLYIIISQLLWLEN